MADRDAYEVLGLARHAQQVVVVAAYRALAALYHPDANSSPSATRRMAELNDAFAKLRTADRRELYDRSLALAEHASSPVQPQPAQANQVTPPAAARVDSSVLDFGRYEGWSLEQLAKHDPDYLLWLERHSSGIRYRRRIRELLSAATPNGPPMRRNR
jgi:curved DNA-binding protein CbpA